MTAKDIESILWLVPAIPLMAALINGFLSITFLRSKPKASLSSGQLTIRYVTSFIGITAIVSALIVSLICLFYLIGQPAPKPAEGEKHAAVNSSQVVASAE